LARDAGSVERPGRIGYCPQLPMVWEKLTVDEHFELFARAYGLERSAGVEAAEELLDELISGSRPGPDVSDPDGTAEASEGLGPCTSLRLIST
jgi:ABC-2 type transport system ATP-binding protein